MTTKVEPTVERKINMKEPKYKIGDELRHDTGYYMTVTGIEKDDKPTGLDIKPTNPPTEPNK